MSSNREICGPAACRSSCGSGRPGPSRIRSITIGISRRPASGRGVDLTLSRNAGMTVAEVDEILGEDPSADVGVHGGHDPVARLKDLWRDGTVADVLYPTAGLSIFQFDDVELQEACCRVYNDWLSEFCAVDRDRLRGLALIPTFDMGRAVTELRRGHGAGLRGAIIWTAPPEGDTFFDPRYEPLWSAAAELSMPISLHILAGRKGSQKLADYNKDVEGTFYFGFETRQELQRSVCELIAAGVFERHPDLRVVAAEGGIDYAANLEEKLDRSFTSFWGKLTDMKMLPSEYFRRNVLLTFIEDQDRPQQPALHRFRPFHVVERLSPRRGHLAPFGGVRGRSGGRRRPRRRRPWPT